MNGVMIDAGNAGLGMLAGDVNSPATYAGANIQDPVDFGGKFAACEVTIQDGCVHSMPCTSLALLCIRLREELFSQS